MNAFERIFNRIIYILVHKVGHFLATLLTLYLSVWSACLLGFIVGGLLGYFTWVGFLELVFSDLNLNCFAIGVIVGVVYLLTLLTLSFIGGFYELLTGRNNIGKYL